MSDRLVRHIFNRRKTDGDVGVEVEMEVEGINDFPFAKGWRITHDGSLRGHAAEYVFSQPLNVAEAKNTVQNLQARLKEADLNITSSIRAGVHVHVNCQEMTMEEVKAFACLYYILENPLSAWCGENRVGNHFCLRACDAEYVQDQIINAFRTGEYYLFDTDNLRYAALNWMALTRYGSLEFRAMATEPDLSRICDWIDILLKIRDASNQYVGDLHKMISDVSMSTPIGFIENILDDKAEVLLSRINNPEAMNNIQQEVFTGMRVAQDIIFFSEAN